MEVKKQFKWFTIFEYEKEQDYFSYSYFRKAVSDDGIAEEIFCDDESRLQMMQRVLRGRMLPLLITNLFDTHNYFIAAFVGGVLTMYIMIFVTFFVKYSQYKSNRK